MTEWTVVAVLGVLVSLGVAIIKPIVSLTRAITQLTVTVDALQKDLDAFSRKNSDSHARLWQHNEKQDARLDEHERRLNNVEGRNNTWRT